ncbi:DUF1643 domain-containing protein [Variovorax sp. VNK109]|uniref:DUF1643 domain-containing protein n=1 Tax=Variovorax sp. VNK109 TaxID=3400919 RepID=UPI003BFBEB37
MFDIYHSDEGDTWRYTLGQSGERPLLVIGLNPSTATQERADPTVARVRKVAALHGYGGFVMLNLYPVRATDYRKLPVTVSKVAFERNLQAIEDVVAQVPEPHIWATWGQSVTYHGYFLKARDQLIERLAKYNPKWFRLGELTATGHPRHASRLDYNWRLSAFDLE